MAKIAYEIINGFDAISRVLDVYGLSVEDAEQLKFNNAFVFDLPDAMVLMISNDGLIAMRFSDRETFEKMLKEKRFPVPEPSSIFCTEREFVKHLNKSVDEYIRRLNVLGVNTLPSSTKVESSLNDLSMRINTIGKNNIDHSVYVALGIYLGEIIRREKKGKWKWEVKSAINPYYIPVLEYGNGRTSALWRSLDEHWTKRKRISLMLLKDDILEFYDI